MPDTPLAALDARLQKLAENARVALDRGNLDYALEVTTQVLKVAPGCVAVRRLQRTAQVRQTAGRSGLLARTLGRVSVAPFLFAGGAKDPAQMLAGAEKLLAADPLNVAALKQLATAARALDWPETAVLALEAVREIAPGDHANTIALGEAWLALNRPQEALRLADEVLRTRPVDAAAQNLMRTASIAQTMAQGRWEGGQGFRTKLKDEATAAALETAARTVNTADATERLVREAEARVTAEPDNLNHYRAVVHGLRQLGRNDEALGWLQRARALPAGAADAALAKEETALRLVQLEARMSAAEAACMATPEDAAAREKLAAAREGVAAFRLSAAQAFVERYPNDLTARQELGELLLAGGRVDAAIAQFQAAAKSPATRVAALVGLGRCFATKKLFDLAVAQLSTAKAELGAMTEQKKEVLYQLGMALEAMGRREEAIAEFKAIYSEDIGFRDVLDKINAYYAS